MATTPRLQGRITRVSIEGFRSLQKVDNLELPQLTVLIGSNGAGKSNFIRFFDMLGWMLKTQNLQEFIIRNGGADDQLFMGAQKTSHIVADIGIETDSHLINYHFGLASITGDTLMISSESYSYSDKAHLQIKHALTMGANRKEAGITGEKSARAKTIVHLLRQCSVFQFHDTSPNAPIHNRCDITDGARLRADGGNLAAVLLDLFDNDLPRYKQIVRQIQRVLPTFGDFVLEPTSGKVLLRWRSKYGDKVFGAHLTSDGSLRLFCLLTLLNMPDDRLPDVLFLDEPELGLHPHAIILISEMLKRVAQTRQVFIATQSPWMVDCFDLENIIVADLKDGATSLRNLSREQYQEWLDDDFLLSEIWLKTAA